jgi:hypothetical protein
VWAQKAFFVDTELAFQVDKQQLRRDWAPGGCCDGVRPDDTVMSHMDSLVSENVDADTSALQTGQDVLAVVALGGAAIALPLVKTERFILTAAYYFVPGAISTCPGVVYSEEQLIPLIEPFGPQIEKHQPIDKESFFAVVSSRGEPVALPLEGTGELVEAHAATWDEEGALVLRGRRYFSVGVDNW